MIKTKFLGKAPYPYEFPDWPLASEDGNLIIIIHTEEKLNQAKLLIYYHEDGDYYQEIQNNFILPEYAYGVLWEQNNDKSYLIAVSASENQFIYKIDISTKQVTQFYQKKEEQYLLVFNRFIFDLSHEGDLKITYIDKSMDCKQILIKCVENIHFLVSNKNKEQELLEIELFDEENQYYTLPQLKQVFEYDHIERLSISKTTLYLHPFQGTEYLYRVFRKLNLNNTCLYKYQKQEAYSVRIYNNIKNTIVNDRNLLQIRPKSKIIRRFKRQAYCYQITAPYLIIQSVIENSQQYLHFITDIRSAQEQQILNSFKIAITNGIILEQQQEHLYIYELEIIQ